jgi:hypothetical protein
MTPDGGDGREADFSTSLRFGRNDMFFIDVKVLNRSVAVVWWEALKGLLAGSIPSW